MFRDTETAELAHLVLPAAGCGEKDGTFINSERRIGAVRRVVDPPGEALPDLHIFQKIAEAWGCATLLRGLDVTGGRLRHHEEALTGDALRLLGHRGLRRRSKAPEASSGLIPTARDRVGGPGRRLFEDGEFYTPDGRARFVFEDPVAPPSNRTREYPFVLLTGRGSVTQWHTLTRTDRAPALKKASPDPAYVEMNPLDAEHWR